MDVSPSTNRVLRYGCAVAASAVALLITWGLGPQVVGITPFFFAAVMISAWIGGLGPGLLATLLAGVSSAYFFVEPPNSLWIGPDDLIREAMFIAVAVFISYLQHSTRESEERLRQAKVAADAASQAKDQFLAVLSHELRNPLNPVLSLASMHERDLSLPASLREDFAMIRRNIELEARLIDDLLDLNRITKGKLSMHLEPADVHELIRDAAFICRDAIRSKGLRLSLELGAQRSYVIGDAARLRQVIWNLLKNAIKFTPPHGSITICTNRGDAQAGAEAEFVEIAVRDTGIGLEPEVRDRIFNAFDQGDVRITQQFGGLGLGLSISKMLVELHGGSIRAHSEGKGRGATFTVALPLTSRVPADRAAPGSSASSPVAERARAARILLVEDHEDTCRIMSKLLRAARHEVATAGSVGDALRVAQGQQFDLVIADLGLPDGSGLDLMTQLKHVYGLPGIALTGYGMHDDIARTRQAGFAHHLTKPVDLVKLEDAIQHLAGVEEPQETDGPTTSPAPPLAAEPAPASTSTPTAATATAAARAVHV
jgi:signal transduction histidine kinase/ActR/RegA family two-component response regulator